MKILHNRIYAIIFAADNNRMSLMGHSPQMYKKYFNTLPVCLLIKHLNQIKNEKRR